MPGARILLDIQLDVARALEEKNLRALAQAGHHDVDYMIMAACIAGGRVSAMLPDIAGSATCRTALGCAGIQSLSEPPNHHLASTSPPSTPQAN